MSASVRVLASVIATLSAVPAFADVRPVPPSNGPVTPFPGHGPGRGPGRGPGHPYPGPSNPYPAPVPPPHNYPRPPAFEEFECRDMYNGYDFFTITQASYSRSGYVLDINAHNITASGIEIYVLNRTYDAIDFRFNSHFGNSQISIGYLNHPYGPTAMLSLGGGQYQEFKCKRLRGSPNRPAPVPPYPYPPNSPYPPSPYPHR